MSGFESLQGNNRAIGLRLIAFILSPPPNELRSQLMVASNPWRKEEDFGEGVIADSLFFEYKLPGFLSTSSIQFQNDPEYLFCQVLNRQAVWQESGSVPS